MCDTHFKRYECDNVKIDNKGTLLVKPSGLYKVVEILNELKTNGVEIERCVRILDYNTYARNVFFSVSSEEHDIWRLIFDTYFAELKNEAMLLYCYKANYPVPKPSFQIKLFHILKHSQIP